METPLKIKLKKLQKRLRIAYHVLFTHRHFFCASITRDGLYKMFTGEHYEVDIEFVGLQEYNVRLMIREIDAGVDEIDLSLMKADFEAMAEQQTTKK